jgi:3-dehydroquinate synthase
VTDQYLPKTTRLQIVLDAGRSYDIRVGSGLLASAGEQLRVVSALSQINQAVVLSDSNVGPLYARAAREALHAAGFSTTLFSVAAGEQSKSLANAGELWEAFAAAGIGRDTVVVALGGGVVGDLAGFVASTWMRGVPFVQLPSSLLAMVDSSIGGKTAIDLAAGKNLVGSFYQPAYVLCDLNLLDSLPDAEWANGLAELVKSAIIDSPEFYNWLLENNAALAARERPVLAQAIVRALRFKASVVVADEREAGRRECLNYGHTFAHALETCAGFGAVGHGRAVAEGIRFAARLATEAVGAPVEFAVEQEAALEALALFTPLAPAVAHVRAEELYAAMLSDKKVRDGAVRFVFAEAPGHWQATLVDPDLIKIYLLYWQQAQQ